MIILITAQEMQALGVLDDFHKYESKTAAGRTHKYVPSPGWTQSVLIPAIVKTFKSKSKTKAFFKNAGHYFY